MKPSTKPTSKKFEAPSMVHDAGRHREGKGPCGDSALVREGHLLGLGLLACC